MNFAEALHKLHHGGRVARAAWAERNVWICMAKGNPKLPADNFLNEHTRKFAMDNGGYAELLPYIIMKTEDDKFQIGWMASQADMVAQDWLILV